MVFVQMGYAIDLALSELRDVQNVSCAPFVPAKTLPRHLQTMWQ